MSFTDEEIKTAKQAREVIIKDGTPKQKAVYMAGEICMWDELQQEKVNGTATSDEAVNIAGVVISEERAELKGFAQFLHDREYLVRRSVDEVIHEFKNPFN